MEKIKKMDPSSCFRLVGKADARNLEFGAWNFMELVFLFNAIPAGLMVG